jgi:hypothetical protein
MDLDTKLFLGKVLGEIYRTQKHMEGVVLPVGDAEIFGLLNGIEEVVDKEIPNTEYISNQKIKDMDSILRQIETKDEGLTEFKGYRDIERDLEEKGINRGEAITILTYFKVKNYYYNIIKKMDSSDSPCECRRFEICDSQK